MRTIELFRLMGTIAVDNDTANKEIDETTGKVEQSESKMSSAFKKIGAAVAAAFAIDKIVQFGKSVVEATATVAAEQSAFEQIMGDYTNNATEKVNQIADATGMVSTRLTPYMTSMTAKFKGLGYDIDDATTLAKDGLTLAADASAFWDKSLEDSMGALNSFVNGSYEGGEAIGLFANDTQMAQYAVQNSIVKSTKDWANLDEATKQATRLEYAQAMFEASGAVGQAAKESGQYANVQANLTEKWRQFKAQIGEPLLQNIVIPAMDKLSSLVTVVSQKYQELSGWLKDVKAWFQENKSAIEGVTTALGFATAAVVAFKVGSMIQSVVQGFQQARVAIALFTATSNGATVAQGLFNGALTIGETLVALFTGKVTLAQIAQAAWAATTNAVKTAMTALNAVMVANPIGLIVAAIGLLVAGFIYLWNTSEGFRNFWINLWKVVSSAFSVAWDAIINFFTVTIPNVFNAVIDFFKNNWQILLSFIINPFGTAFALLYENCEGFRNFVDNFVETIKSFFINMWNSIVTFFTESVPTFFANVVMWFSQLFTNIVNFFAMLPSTIALWVNNVFTVISTWATTMVNKAVEMASNFFNSIVNWFKQLPGRIQSFLSSVISNVATFASNLISRGTSAAKGLYNALVNGIKSLPSKFMSIGSDIVDGLWDGIRSGWDWLTSKVRNLASSLLSSAKKALKISSPSKLFRDEVGKYVSEGLGVGIEDNADSPISAIEKVKRGILKTAQNIDVASEITPSTLYNYSTTNNTSNMESKLDRLLSAITEYMPQLLTNSNKNIVLSTGEVVGALTPYMDAGLGDLNKMRERGR